MKQTKRLFVFIAGLLVWSVLLAEIFMVRSAQSYTPIINNVRRAMNDCVVRGRLAPDPAADGSVTFNSRIICEGATPRAEQPAQPRRQQ